MKINKLTNGSKALLAGGLLCCLALAGCFREDLVPGKEGTPDEARTYGLGFTIAADALTKATDGERGSMQYGNEIENYIDPTQLRVLFLDKDGNFQYEFSQYEDRDEGGNPRSNDKLKSGLHLEPLRLNHDGGAVSQWFARIPIDQLSDEQLKLITDEGFKIAIMANWPEETFYGDAYGSINTNFLAGGEQNLANRLAHCHYDEKYTEDTNDETGIYASYLPFLGKGKAVTDGKEYNQMSVSTGWVKTHFTELKNDDPNVKEIYERFYEAETYIREKYHPYFESGERAYLLGKTNRKYYNMWYVWNFGGSYNAIQTTQDTAYYDARGDRMDEIRNAWITRNEEVGWAGPVKNITEESNVQTNPFNNDDDVIVYSGSLQSGDKDGVYMDLSKEYYSVVETSNGRGVMLTGVNLKPEDAVTRMKATNPTFSYLKIPLAADGHLRLKVGAICGGDNETHNVRLGLYYDAGSDAQSVSFDIAENMKPGELYNKVLDFTVLINETAVDTYLYAISENPNDRLIIYEIEYLKAWHLSDVDRDGMKATKDHPIPMYGIQDFDPIGAYWVPGELFNLSANNGLHPDNRYNYKWISLLRSVAKVELKIAKAPFGGKKPAYVYMRSMNQTARLNPIDVLTPTNQIWYGDAEHNLVGIVQETANIQAYGPIYEGKNATSTMDHFHQRLAWFFGVWTHEKVGISSPTDPLKKWDWNKGINAHYAHIDVDIDKSIPYPRVFNPHINRSDYTHFIEQGEDDYYWYYMLYVPEKNMTDANNPGNVTQAPKCLRVEMRWPDVNDDSSLDDNASYRIYFADPNKSGHLAGEYNRDDYENVTSTPGMDYDGAYENDLANLKAFFPIVRNHLYQVTVSGINQGDIKYRVNGPAERKVEIEFE